MTTVPVFMARFVCAERRRFLNVPPRYPHCASYVLPMCFRHFPRKHGHEAVRGTRGRGMSERVKLTKPVVKGAKKGAIERFIWDTELPGFGLRVWPSGRRAFIVQ